MPPRDVFLALLPPILWATGYSIGKGALLHFQPLFTTAMMYAVAGVILYRPRLGLRTPLVWLLIMSVFACGLQSALIFHGIALVDTSLANLVVQAQVPFAILAAILLGLERPNPLRLAGVGLAMLGIALVVGWPRPGSTFLGLASILAGTASWGLGQALIRMHSRDAIRQLVGAMSLLAVPQLLAVSLLVEKDHVRLLATASGYEWFGVALLGLGAFVVAYLLWYGLLARNRMDQVAPFALLMPLVGMFNGVVFFGERLTPAFLFGAALVLAGLVVTIFARDARVGGGAPPEVGTPAG
ncbi:MAG: EamA family transporter [Paracoccaceae bacterium]|jgi:O-acetylserine/cysteine efflux transporter